ncbi:hypothetical protein HPB49_017560 [Dermacentor silvarum]|uniref:Uncharacterized protein n=1 Tax=Dermacentor silvarum TaxID=543639 RepID=A0ACB8D6Z4_DERSI|nr:hypothetical protein HPB49_017560 [Dermacentor silvarum]
MARKPKKKDIKFIAHEPIIQKFRDFKIFIRRLRKAIGKNERDTAEHIRSNEPVYRVDHIVKERYPTFVDALRDIDDALSMCYLFSSFPKGKVVKPHLVHLCRRVIVEFMHYVIETRALRKVFVSIKGFYYQAEIMGQTVTWIVPHNFSFRQPVDVDFKIMVTFTDFYVTLMGCVNYKLYHSLNLHYPPKLENEPAQPTDADDEDEVSERVASLNSKLKSILTSVVADDAAQLDDFPERDAVAALSIGSFGAEVSWDESLFVGSTFSEKDPTVTHQIVDRPEVKKRYINRYYVQPQWVYDCVNYRKLLPEQDYFMGEVLPPHLSPFVEEKEGDYVPPERQAMLRLQRGEESEGEQEEESGGEDSGVDQQEDSEDEEEEDSDDDEEAVQKSASRKQRSKEAKKRKQPPMEPEPAVAPKKPLIGVQAATVIREDPEKVAQRIKSEEKRLAVLMIPKKHKRLYDKIVFGQKRRAREAAALKQKREEIKKSSKKAKKK